ncbi:hypothetical protein [Sporisorium scitamineum]|uniref:Uncharacterized protein n=1 Tax=Sporisorium scitamineum TaxID=49012 RepID=A0A0F7RWP8_9BASI|nr:hypothetical protein [Sporisorium scitamineum]
MAAISQPPSDGTPNFLASMGGCGIATIPGGFFSGFNAHHPGWLLMSGCAKEPATPQIHRMWEQRIATLDVEPGVLRRESRRQLKRALLIKHADVDKERVDLTESAHRTSQQVA